MAKKTSRRKAPAKAGRAARRDPREWLRKKLGAANYAKFEEGLRAGFKAPMPKEAPAEVEGQTPCSGYCWSYCMDVSAQAGWWSAWFVRV